MADTLTSRLKKELDDRGINASLSVIEKTIKERGFDPQASPYAQKPVRNEADLWKALETGKYPSWYESASDPPEGGMLNALGVGLWQGIDTMALGIPNYLLKAGGVDVEDYLEYDDPAAKWAGAIGGFAGFVGGAPMKIVGAGAKKLGMAVIGSKMLKSAKKETADSVIRLAKQKGAKYGLEPKISKRALKGYRNIVQQSQVNPNMRREAFSARVKEYTAGFIKGQNLTVEQASAVTKMFGEANLYTRPIQDFIGVAVARGGNSRFNRWLGHAANDILMFSAIDGVMESTRYLGENYVGEGGYDFNFTAPMWGAINGLSFSLLGWLSPAGKAATWKKDFMSGLKSAFARNPYKGKTFEQMGATGNFWGGQLKRMGESTEVTIRDKQFDLASRTLIKDLESKFGDSAKKYLTEHLHLERKKWGRQMMKWATTQEASSLGQVWKRMIMGGLLFNTHTFYDMYAHDADIDMVNDIMPHFLIGAYVQRRANPAKFDLNREQMNQLRQNMTTLGVSAESLSGIPTFKSSLPRAHNIFNDAKYKPIEEMMREEGIITDSFEVSRSGLPPGEKSVALPGSENPIYRTLHEFAEGRDIFLKPIDDVSTKQANRIVERALEIEPKLGKPRDRARIFGESILETTESFEGEFSKVIDFIAEADANKVAGIVVGRNRDGARDVRVPSHIEVIDLKGPAERGELEWLRNEAGQKLEGPEAVKELNRFADSINAIIETSIVIGGAKLSKQREHVGLDMNNQDLVGRMFERVRQSEMSMNEQYPNRSMTSKPFRFGEEFYDYIQMISHNHSIRLAENSIGIFKEDFGDKNILKQRLAEARILQTPGEIGQYKIIDDASKLEIVSREKADKLSEDDIADAKRFLGRVLTLQSIIGSDVYQGHELSKADKNEVDIRDVRSLQSYLKKHGLDLAGMNDYMSSQIVDYALRDKIRGTNLGINQLESLFNLIEYDGMARFETRAEGRAGGFRVFTLNESVLPAGIASQTKALIKKYNNFIRQAQEDSNGLVSIVGERTAGNKNFLLSLNQIIPSESSPVGEARETLTNLLMAINASKHNLGAFTHQMEYFMNADPRNAHRLLKWLVNTKVLKVGKKMKYEEPDIDILVQEMKGQKKKVFEDISDMMSFYGFTPNYAKRLYEKYEQEARDRLWEDIDEADYTPGITLQDFYSKYRIDGINEKGESVEQMNENFQALIYSNVKDQTTYNNLVNKVLENISVRMGTRYYSLANMSATNRMKRTPEVIRDITGLLVQQIKQRRINVIKWVDGSLRQTDDVIQASPFHDFVNRELQINYSLVDTKASIYETSADGRYTRRLEVNMFGNTDNLSKDIIDHIVSVRENFERVLNKHIVIDGEQAVSPDGEAGISIMRLLPNMEPIAIRATELRNIHEPFSSFTDRMHGIDGIKRGVLNKFDKLRDSFEAERPSTFNEYNEALKYLVAERMLTGSDGTRTFVEFLNGKNTIKLANRIKLFNTKKFVKPTKKWIKSVRNAYGRAGDTDTVGALKRILDNDGFRVSVWDDVNNANLRQEVERIVEDMELSDRWNSHDVLGKAHIDVTSFDSISFVSRDVMRYAHAIVGHDPNSFTPLKPVFTSGGSDAPLLLGKSLLVYSEHLDPYFSRTKTDILLSRSGAKALNPFGPRDGADMSLVSDTFENLREKTTVGRGQIRHIPFEALGLKADKDYESNTAKTSMADHNYTTNSEASAVYKEIYGHHVDNAINNMRNLMSEPIALRKWLILESGQDGNMLTSTAESEGMTHFNNAVFYASLSRDADPMSYSPAIVKNKLYGMYINRLINNMRSVSNHRDREAGDNNQVYGGQSILIQTQHRLKPTLVDKKGEMVMRGEVMLPAYEKNTPIKILAERGIEVRFVYAGVEMKEGMRESLTGREVFGEDRWNEILRAHGEGDLTLGGLHELVKETPMGKAGLTLGIAVRRNPRTRPNDMSLLGLTGFLEESYGNSMQINSLDVANVYEGDYDVDKADYWTSNRDSFYKHIDRASKFYVQGIDPTSLMVERPLNFGTMSTTEVVEAMDKIAADTDLYKSSIGIVQKIPRKLGFAEKLASRLEPDDLMVNNFNTDNPSKKLGDPRVLLGGNENQPWRIIVDYNSNDFFTRSALETQYIIDGTGKINSEISRDIYSWADNFLFPKMKDSYAPGEAKGHEVHLINDMRTQGQSQKRRIRIFRKIEFDKDLGKYKEVNLSKLDIAMIKEMLSEYGKFLNATGDSLYEKSGAKKKVSYEDVYDASESFFLFNNNINNSLYYRLRNKYQDRNNKGAGRWRDEDSPGGKNFKELFGVVSDTYKKDGETKKYFKPTNNVVNEDAISNAVEFYNGERGAPVDRILNQLYHGDPFNRRRYRSATGDIPRMVDSWYSEIIGGSNSSDIAKATDLLRSQIVDAALTYNRKVKLIGSLKYKIVQINNNTNVPYKTRQESIKKINKLIGDVETEIASLVNEKYWKTRKTKDLKKMTFTSIEDESANQGIIYYNTMNSLRESLPFIGGRKNFGLNSDGMRLMTQLNNIRRIFYGNRTSLGDVLTYGDKTVLKSGERELLNSFDSDLSTMSQVENKLLLQGVESHSIRFLFKFMTPNRDDYSIGIFNGEPMPMPYKATEKYDPGSRYRRGIKFLTGIASGSIETNSAGTRQGAIQMLRYIQAIEAQWQRYFNRKVDMRKMYDESKLTTDEAAHLFKYLKVPEFNDNFKRMYTRYEGLRWGKGRDRIGHGRSLTNNHLFDFYSSMMQASGKAEEFETYATEMNSIQERMIAGEIIDPYEYLSIRSKLDRDVVKVAKTVFTGGYMHESGNNKFVQKILNNPVYALMGGEGYFKGLSLETQPKRSMERLKEIRKLSHDTENMKNKVNIKSLSHKEKLDNLIEQCHL